MSDDDDKDRRAPMHWGDMGALVLAGGFSLFGLYLIANMAMGGHPLAVLFGQPAEPVEPAAKPQSLSEQEIRALPFHAEKGEVVILTSHPGIFAHVPFPQVRNWASVRIGLQRTLCFGSCPSYSVEISGDGSVVYRGEDCVAQKGERRARIPQAQVAQLVRKFSDADFFSLRDRFHAEVTDSPTQRISIGFDGRSKTVEDYVGVEDGMPRAVRDLEAAIDDTARTGRWISGGTRTCDGRPVE